MRCDGKNSLDYDFSEKRRHIERVLKRKWIETATVARVSDFIFGIEKNATGNEK